MIYWAVCGELLLVSESEVVVGWLDWEFDYGRGSRVLIVFQRSCITKVIRHAEISI